MMTVPSFADQRVPASVHFTLRSPILEMGSAINELYGAAKRRGFEVTAPLVTLVGEDCAVGDRDVFTGLKVRARGLLIEPGNVISYMPIEIKGFQLALPNGNPFFLGLCRYPAKIEVGSNSVPTGVAGAQWMSYVHTIRAEDKADVSLESHLRALLLLRDAERLGILTAVSDPFRQWHRPDRRLFSRLCCEDGSLAAH